jgi:predicted DNA-binding protein
MESKQTQENTKHTNVRLPADMYDAVDALAKQAQRNISQQIRYIIQEYLRIKAG